MEKAVLRLRTDRYFCNGNADPNISHLSLFLEEIQSYVFGFKRLVLQPNFEDDYTDYTDVEKDENEIVVTMDWSKTPFEDDGTEFRIQLDQFVWLLDEWRDLHRQRPEEIIITQIDGEIMIEGRGFPDPPYDYFKDEYIPSEFTQEFKGCFEMYKKEGFYTSNSLLSEEKGIFFSFLSGDLNFYGAGKYRSWATDVASNKLCGDIAFFVKKDGHVIIKSFLTLKYPDRYFAMTQKQFLEMLDRWEHIQKVSPERFFVECKDGDVTFSAVAKECEA